MDIQSEPLPPPPVDQPDESRTSRKWWYIGGAIVVILFVVPGLLVLLGSSKPGTKPATNTNSNLKDVALADKAKIDVHHLPGGQILFFTMMQRTAQKTAIAGDYGEAEYSDPNQPGKPITERYQLRGDTWSNGKVTSFNYADLSWNPSEMITELQRCVGGKYGIYASSKADLGWQPQSAASSKLECTVNSQSTGNGETTIDGLLTGGLSHNQAAVWVDLLASSKDKASGKPLFTFEAPQLTTLNGKQVIGLKYTINNIWDTRLCDNTCGLNSVLGALQKAQIDPSANGYVIDYLADSATGMYYIDPTSLLPVQSQMTTANDQGPSTEYRRAFQYTMPDFSHTSTAKATATPALIQGFVEIQDNL